MAISGKDVQVWMWRVVKFSMRFAYTSIKNHPFLSCPLLSFLALYICFPSFFCISLYSSAFLILVISVSRVYVWHQNARGFRRRDDKNTDAELIRKDDFAKNDPGNNRNGKYFVRARSVRRRKSKETSRDSSVHTSEDEKSTVFSSSFNNNMVDKSALTDERPKEIREIEVDSVSAHAECSSSNDTSGLRPQLHGTSYERSQRFGGDSGGGDVEIESSDGTDEEDEQEREANNKAVQWTETDQKNLMDLGFSEIERNKRLESLIARRRARKMLSLQVRRSLVNMDCLVNHGPMTTLTIPRPNNPFIAAQSAGNFSTMPGSAPSVLLPNQNPFDLPYDPQEEKPNLTGGSFHQEFKDMTFSRHESANNLAASFYGDLKDNQQEISLSNDPNKKDRDSQVLENSTVEGQLDENTDKIIEVESCQAPKSDLNTVTADRAINKDVANFEQGMDLVIKCQDGRNSEVQTKSVLIEDSIDKLSSSSSSEDDVPIPRVNKDAVLRSLASPLLRNMSLNREENSKTGEVGDNYGPSVFDKNKMQDHFSYVDKAMQYNHHTPMSSIASDLQVEVSEVSSLAQTDDGTISCPEEELSACNGDMEDEGTTGNEDVGALVQIDGNEPKEVHDTNQEVGYSGTKNCATASLYKTSAKELSDQSQDHSANFHSKNEDNFRSSASSYSLHTLVSDSLALPGQDEVQQLKEDLMTNSWVNDDAVKPELPSYSSNKSKGEFSTIYNVDDSNVIQNSIRGTDDLDNLLVKQDRREPTKPSEASSSKSADYTESQSKKTEGRHNIMELDSKNVHSKVTKDTGGDLKDIKQDKMDGSMEIENNDALEAIQVNEGEHLRTEQRYSRIRHPSFSGYQVESVLPASVLGQLRIDSSASSPRSVLQPDISVHSSSLTSFSDDMHDEIHQFRPHRVENGMLGQARDEGLSYTPPQRSMPFMADSRSPLSHEGTAEIVEESSIHPTCTKDAYTTGSMSEDMFHENERKQNKINYIPEDNQGKCGSSNLSTSINENNSPGFVSEDMVSERRQKKTDSIPEGSSGKQKDSYLLASTDKDNSTGSASEGTIHESERRENKTNYIPEASSGRHESSNLPTSSSEKVSSAGSVTKEMVHDKERRMKANFIPEDGPGRQECSNLSTSTDKGSLIGSIGEETVREIGRRPDKDNIPEGGTERQVSSNLETSDKGDSFMGPVSQKLMHGNEMKVIPEGSSHKLSSSDSAALTKLPEEINSSSLDVGQGYSNLLTSAVKDKSIGSLRQVIHGDENKQNEANDITEGNSNNLTSFDSELMGKSNSSHLPVFDLNKETSSIVTVTEHIIPVFGRGENDAEDLSDGNLERFGHDPESTVALLKGIGHFSSDIPHTKQESSNLSHSDKEANRMRLVHQYRIHGNEKGENEAKDIPEGSSQGFSSTEAAAVPPKSIDEIGSRSLTMTDDRYNKLHKHEVENLFNPVDQADKLSTPITKTDGSSNLSAFPDEGNNATRFGDECVIHEHEENQVKDISEGSSQGLNSPNATAAQPTSIEEVTSRSLIMTDEGYVELHRHQAKLEAVPALLNPPDQVNKLSISTIIKEEPSHLSASPEEANAMIFVDERTIHKNEKGETEAKAIPDGSSQRLGSPDATAAIPKSVEQISSRSLIMDSDRYDELHKHEAENEALTATLNPVDQVNKLSTLIIHKEENPSGVTYKEGVLNPAVGVAKASTSPTCSIRSQGNMNGLQKLDSQVDHTGLLILLESNKVTADNYLPKSAGGSGKSLEGGLKIPSPEDITEDKQYKSAEENKTRTIIR